MKNFKLFTVLSILVMIVSACGAEPLPTVSAADVQLTAVAAAFTIVAETQAAIPTATPLPPTSTPTQTPAVTDTPVSLPTIAGSPTVASAPTTASGGDPCATRVLSYSPRGRETIIRIVNETRAPVTVSIYLNETAGAGECGYRSYSLGRQSDVVITDLVQGCYNLWAWGEGNGAHVNAGGYGCINNSDKWTFEIGEGSIKFVGP